MANYQAIFADRERVLGRDHPGTLIAARLIADPERIAQTISSEELSKDLALADIATALAATDRTKRAAPLSPSPISAGWTARSPASRRNWRSITRPARNVSPSPSQMATGGSAGYWRVSALARISKALAATDPDRRRRACG